MTDFKTMGKLTAAVQAIAAALTDKSAPVAATSKHLEHLEHLQYISASLARIADALEARN